MLGSDFWGVLAAFVLFIAFLLGTVVAPLLLWLVL